VRSDGLLEGVSGEHEALMLNPVPEDIAELMQDATKALNCQRRERTKVSGEPILIVPGVTSQVRLPNLIPDAWQPALTEMIMQAVEKDCAQPSSS
jgi:hypothetical protein